MQSAVVRKKRGGEEMKVSLAMLMKTNLEKMADGYPTTMLMKRRELYVFTTMCMKTNGVVRRDKPAGSRE